MNNMLEIDQVSDINTSKIVYVREVNIEELPLQVQNKVGDCNVLYSVNDEEGQRIALVADRKLAFTLARQNDLAPVSVH